MKDLRTMSFQLSQAISKEELENISAAGQTNSWTANGTYQHGQWDGCVDVSWDM